MAVSYTGHEMTIADQPVANVQWWERELLTANDYNPNHVAPPELELLARSILEDGWTQPIVVHEDGTIVDGFHRYTVAARPEIDALTGGQVPVVVVEQDATHAKMSTIRHNRARGTHGVLRMADLVAGMIEAGVAMEEICTRLGMEDEEVLRLADRSGMPVKTAKDKTFGRGWEPEA